MNGFTHQQSFDDFPMKKPLFHSGIFLFDFTWPDGHWFFWGEEDHILGNDGWSHRYHREIWYGWCGAEGGIKEGQPFVFCFQVNL